VNGPGPSTTSSPPDFNAKPDGASSFRTENGSSGGTIFNWQYWAPSRIRAIAWRALTVIACPCCIPIWVWVLSGTAIGALLSRNLILTGVLYLVFFSYCFVKALRSYDQPGSTPGNGGEHGAR